MIDLYHPNGNKITYRNEAISISAVFKMRQGTILQQWAHSH